MDPIVAAMQERKLSELAGAITRPSMYAHSAQALEVTIRGLILDLLELGERPAERAFDPLLPYGKRGVFGAFDAAFGGELRAEVASVFGALAARAGLFEVKSSEHDLAQLATEAREFARRNDLTMADVADAWGEPQLVLDERISCFVTRSGEWVCVDGWSERPLRWNPDRGHLSRPIDDNPFVRAIRLPSGGFVDRLLLTPYGKWLVLGGDWRLFDEAEKYPAGVREQLRQIHQDDPSESLRLRRTWPGES